MIKIDTYVSEEPSYYELIVAGEVDASSSIYLEEGLKVAMSESDWIIVNLAELDYISSAGLGVFVSVIEELDSKNIKMVLCEMSEKVTEVFEILGLHQLITMKLSKEEALSTVN